MVKKRQPRRLPDPKRQKSLSILKGTMRRLMKGKPIPYVLSTVIPDTDDYGKQIGRIVVVSANLAGEGRQIVSAMIQWLQDNGYIGTDGGASEKDQA